jgi:uncharacterized membrane protein
MEDRHPRRATPIDILRTTTLGFVGGLRSLMPLAVLSAYLQRQGADIADGGWTLDLLASSPGALVLGAAAIGEVLADKFPFVPTRVAPLPLAGRVVLSGSACALAALAKGRRSDTGALIGAISSVGGSLCGYAWRTRVPLPALVLALSEDTVAFLLSRWAVEH